MALRGAERLLIHDNSIPTAHSQFNPSRASSDLQNNVEKTWHRWSEKHFKKVATLYHDWLTDRSVNHSPSPRETSADEIEPHKIKENSNTVVFVIEELQSSISFFFNLLNNTHVEWYGAGHLIILTSGQYKHNTALDDVDNALQWYNYSYSVWRACCIRKIRRRFRSL